MNKEQFERERNYRVSVAIAKHMLSKNIINENDFEKIKILLVDKYKPILGSLSVN